MVETATEKKVCPKCGVAVRPNTLFCYNCGSAVVGADNAFPTVKDVLLEEEMAERLASEKKSSNDAKLTSAASLRKKKDSASSKTVEVVWEEPDSAPNPWFLVVAFLLTIFAAGVFAVMLYIR